MHKARESVRTFSSRATYALRDARKAAERMTREILSLRGAAAAAAGVGGLALLAQRAINTAATMGDTADKVGVGIEALQEYRFAARRAGVEQNALDMGLQRLTRRIAEAVQGKGELVGVLEQYNIAVTDAEGRTRSTEAVMADLANVIQRTESANERLRIAFKAFDSEGAALVNMLRGGAAGLEATRKRARELGVVLSDDVVRRAQQARNELGDMTEVLKLTATSAALELMPAMRKLAQTITDPAIVQGLRDIVMAGSEFLTFLANAAAKTASFTKRLAEGAAAVRAGAGGKFFDLNADELKAKAAELEAAIAAIRSDPTKRDLKGELFRTWEQQIEILQRDLDQVHLLLSFTPPMAPPDTADAQAAIDTVGQHLVDLGLKSKESKVDVEQLTAALNQQAADTQVLIDTLIAMPDMLGAVETKQRLLNEAQRLGIDLTTQEGQAWLAAAENAAAMSRALEAAKEAHRAATTASAETAANAAETQETTQRGAEAFRQFGFTASHALETLIVSGGKGVDVIDMMIDALKRMLVQMLVIQPLLKMFDMGGAGGGGGGGPLGFLGKIFGGGKAQGGPVQAGKLYRIHEQGLPEFFQPGRSGKVIPLADMGQDRGPGGGLVVNVGPVYADDAVGVRRAVEQGVRQAVEMSGAQTLGMLRQLQRPRFG